MPTKPSKEVLEAKDKEIQPKDILEAVINDMHDDELEARLVEAGLAIKA